MKKISEGRLREISERFSRGWQQVLHRSATDFRENVWLKFDEAKRKRMEKWVSISQNTQFAVRLLNMRKFYPTDDDISKMTKQGEPDEQSE